MRQLGYWMLGTGAVYVAAHLALVAAPAAARRVLAAFPRNAWVGRALALGTLVWSAFLVNDMPLGFVDPYKGWLYAVTPVVFVLVVLLMGELLAARAFGGLLLLLAEPILASAREPGLSAWRLTMVALAYAWVVAGMVLVLGPYWFRKTAEVVCRTDARCRLAGAAGVVVGVVLVGLGATVFAR